MEFFVGRIQDCGFLKLDFDPNEGYTTRTKLFMNDRLSDLLGFHTEELAARMSGRYYM